MSTKKDDITVFLKFDYMEEAHLVTDVSVAALLLKLQYVYKEHGQEISHAFLGRRMWNQFVDELDATMGTSRRLDRGKPLQFYEMTVIRCWSGPDDMIEVGG